MGFENEAEQSNGRPYRQIDGRSKRPNELTSSIVPRGTSFHRSVELGYSPIAIDPARPSCRRRRGRHCGRPPASLRTSPGGTVRFRFVVLHDHVMVVLRPCEAKLSGLRCLTIIGTEGIEPRSTCRLASINPSQSGPCLG